MISVTPLKLNMTGLQELARYAALIKP